MCGIFGYVGPENAIKIVLNGLKKLEYRGYDSAGIAGLDHGKILYYKEVGKLEVLEKEIQKSNKNWHSNTAIGHTRWATHGIPTKINAHPHLDTGESIAIVHNGIIENFEVLKQSLIKKGVKFISDTDTEVVAHLIASFYQGDFLKAVQEVVPLLEGAFAIVVLHRDHPNEIIAFANQAPLVIGLSEKETFIASDPHAFATYTRDVIFPGNFEIVHAKPGQAQIYDVSRNNVSKAKMQLGIADSEPSKGNFEHFTLKEIHEQPQTIRNALADRFLQDYGNVTFEETKLESIDLQSIERILILACGTSWHAGIVGKYMLEDRARIPVQVEISSEFRYRNPVVSHGTCVIAISQSGETADTLAAVREVKSKGAKILSLCNVQGSTLARESDATIYLRAGREIGVCSTKAYTNQVVVLAMLTILLARMRHMSKEDGQQFLNALKDLPNVVQEVLNNAEHIQKLAKKYAHYKDFFFIGRNYMFPTSLEGALKLKEISYINANGYAAGEMKHGPIALLNKECPVMALCANKTTFGKMLSNLSETKARHSPLIAIAEEGNEKVEEIANDWIFVPETIDELATIPTTVATQLFAYYVAKEKGADIDHPRNLAKSVTVE